jgi:hypothetical protein
MSGAIPPFPNTPSWNGARLKPRDNFIFNFTLRLESGNRHLPIIGRTVAQRRSTRRGRGPRSVGSELDATLHVSSDIPL